MATITENIQTLRSIKSDIKNAIIQKGGSVTDAFGTYAQAITDLPSGGGGGTEIEDALITRTISEYSNDRISRAGNGAFQNCSLLTSINLPLCTSVGNNTFENCTLLSTINLPLCEYIGVSAFHYCPSLTYISLPNCSYAGGFIFYFCKSLITVSIPNCTSIDIRAFGYCSNLTQVYLNSVSTVTTIQSNTFSNCPNLTSVYVPASLVDAFKTAQYWSSISDKIVAYTGAQVGTEDML